ncbi:hypothetical protein GCM10020220_063780 [Nonomuraea rubra]|uniref:ABATE domain-containing protein n=1 Tax=Nonomuraea rubra TaxID=46180 RepID=UPI0033760AC7
MRDAATIAARHLRALFAARVGGLPPHPAALSAVNDALTRLPRPLCSSGTRKSGPFRAIPCPTNEILDRALATLAANAADLLTGPDAGRLTACGSPPATATCYATAAATGAPPAAATAPRRPRPTPGAPPRRRADAAGRVPDRGQSGHVGQQRPGEGRGLLHTQSGTTPGRLGMRVLTEKSPGHRRDPIHVTPFGGRQRRATLRRAASAAPSRSTALRRGPASPDNATRARQPFEGQGHGPAGSPIERATSSPRNWQSRPAPRPRAVRR